MEMIGRVTLTFIFLHLIVCILYFASNFYKKSDFLSFLKGLSWINLGGVLVIIGIIYNKIRKTNDGFGTMGIVELSLLLFLMVGYSGFITYKLNFSKKTN